jgi:hypothetical protein
MALRSLVRPIARPLTHAARHPGLSTIKRCQPMSSNGLRNISRKPFLSLAARLEDAPSSTSSTHPLRALTVRELKSVAKAAGIPEY